MNLKLRSSAGTALTIGISVGSHRLWRTRQIENDKFGLVRLVDDDLIEPDRGVHATNVLGVLTLGVRHRQGIGCGRLRIAGLKGEVRV